MPSPVIWCRTGTCTVTWILIPEPFGETVPDVQMIEDIASRMSGASNKGELGIILAEDLQRFSIYELQVIGGRLNIEIHNLPFPYRNNVKPYLHDQVFGAYHALLSKYRRGEFNTLFVPIRDHDEFISYCHMLPSGCTAWDETMWKNPDIWGPKHRLFYYLVSAFTMYVEDLPGHPVGMPFPGGQVVEKRGQEYYCPIRDKEKDVFFSICNFCPAQQSDP